MHSISDHKKHTEKIDSQWHLCKWDCGMWVCTQHDERGIHHHLAALLLLLLLPLALALFTHPLIFAASTPLLLILSTPTPDRVSTLPVPPPPPSSLPASASSLSCSRCSVAIATEKCGNTSVLQRGGWRRGRGEIEAKRKRMGERRRVKRQTEEETRAEEWREDC